MEEIFNEGEVISEKGHYETVKEYTKKVPVYDEEGNQTRTEVVVTGRERQWVWDDPEEIKNQHDKESSVELKAELAQIKEDIEQETFGLVRNDYTAKKARAAEIINELRVIEGKAPREVKVNEKAD